MCDPLEPMIKLKGLMMHVKDTGQTAFASYPLVEFTTTKDASINLVTLRTIVENILRDLDAEDNLPMWSRISIEQRTRPVLQLQVIPASAPHNKNETFPLWAHQNGCGSESKLITLLKP